MCKVLEVKRSCFYQYQRHLNNKGNVVEQKLIAEASALAEASGHTYGSRRLQYALTEKLGYKIGRFKTRMLMKKDAVFVKYRKKYKNTTQSHHQLTVYENKLNRQFDYQEPNKAYVGDITYIWTQEGWLYLAVVIDLFSRKVVGWSMSSRMKTDLVCDALKMALGHRKPQKGLIVHSDRGSQYASKAYKTLLNIHGCIGSMTRKGNCWDNAVSESFFGSLKIERVMWGNYQTRYQAQQDVLNYITMFYKSKRLHSSLGYKTPNQYENTYFAEFKKVA